MKIFIFIFINNLRSYMIENHNKTYVKTSKYNQKPKWYIIDAKDQTLGRLSTKITYVLTGKNKITYTPYIKNNSYIIIINTKFIKLTGNKIKQKIYKRHSGRPGGMKINTLEKIQQKIPNRILEKAIKGMLPKNTLGRMLFHQLKLYPENLHPHSSQKPILIEIK